MNTNTRGRWLVVYVLQMHRGSPQIWLVHSTETWSEKAELVRSENT
jgi:hypothetical protein